MEEEEESTNGGGGKSLNLRQHHELADAPGVSCAWRGRARGVRRCRQGGYGGKGKGPGWWAFGDSGGGIRCLPK